MYRYWCVTLVVFVGFLLAFSSSVRLSHGPPEDGLDWIDNDMVPEPLEKGARWKWYTPSRKANLYATQNEMKLRNALLRESRVGEDLRLPKSLVPISYTLQLLPFLEVGNFTTDGYVEILVNCTATTRNITMNSAELTIDDSSIIIVDATSGGTIVKSGSHIDEQTTREMITIQTTTDLQAGRQYKISIKFISILNTDLRGFYRSSYVENGVTKYLAISDFESPNARRAYPCFDEPNMKAQFTVSLGRKSSGSWSSASNMPLKGTEPIEGLPGYVWDHFETSVLTPTYLTAFLVSEFTATSADPALGVRTPHRIWTRPEYASQTGYALSKAPLIQQHFEDYFEIQYPLPKQDSAGIPDFSAGAMENWGLITYREAYLAIPPNAPRTQYQSSAAVNAHELTHQWFGDYVTLDWWDVLWLNEGFATYFEYLGTAAVEPNWRMEDQYITSDLHYVFGPDGLETSRPMSIPVYTTSDMSAMFDSISYEKGGAVIRMMSDFLGELTFRKGLIRYLSAKALGNAVQDDLFKALNDQAVSDRVSLPTTVKEIMDTWTLQMGYPLITVTRNYDTNTALVAQDRFLLRKNESSTDTKVYQWWVPLTYMGQNSPLNRVSDWLTKDQKSKTITVQQASSKQWIIFNVNQNNYYRVTYDPTNYGLITDQLKSDHLSIPLRNRGQLLDDAFNLALANLISYNIAMDLTLYLEKEIEYVPWRSVLTELDYIDIMLSRTSDFSYWRNHITTIITPYYEQVGFTELPTDSHLTIYSRTDALNWACKIEVPDCVQNAKQKYSDLMKQPSLALSLNQRSLILRTGVESGGKTEFDFAFDQYKATGDTAYLVAMSNSKQADLISSFLEMILDPNTGLKSSDVNTVFTNVAAAPVGNQIAFDFLINRWDDIEKALGTGYFVSFYYSLRSRLNTQSDLDKYIKLRDDHSAILGSSNNVRLGIETVGNNVKWMEQHQQEVGKWLQDKYPKASSATKMQQFYFAPLLAIFLSFFCFIFY